MKDKKSFLNNQTLEQEITEAEHRLNDCIKRYESLCDTVTLYHKKMRIYLNKCFYNADGICILYYDLEMSMLNFLTDEMDSVRYDFEHQAPVGELQLLPYVYKNIIKKDETPHITTFDCQDEEMHDYLSVPPQEEAREKASEASTELGRVIINTFMIMKKASDEPEIESRLLERYKRENKNKLDFYMEHLSDGIKEEKKKLDEAFKETPVGQCYFEAGGMIHETIINMRRKHCVQRDLLPLLEYKAKYDRLMGKDEGGGQSTWEDIIPLYLRTGKWATKWEGLKKEGFLDENYHLTEDIKKDEKSAKRIARFIASSFVKTDGTNEYAPFEKLWGMKDLRTIKADPAEEYCKKLERIFSSLS